jgi:hypothetical protein
MEVKVIPLQNVQEWNDIIFKSAIYDFYHCNSYSTLNTSGEAFLFVVWDDADFIALPLIKRSIEETKFFDCTSVYGYAGPVASKSPEQLSESLFTFFQEKLKQYFHENKIISAFSRLHPIILQTPFLEGLGNIESLNKTVAIDLTLPPEQQRMQYRKSNKSEINQLRKSGFIIKKADSAEEIKKFAEIYEITMQRVNAPAHYFFNLDYFNNFLSATDFSSVLLLAYYNNEIAAGAIFTMINNIMQYHLAGTAEVFLKKAPMKLIIDEARLLANSRKLTYFHLGGGVGGSDDDSLFKFKSGFSNLNYVFKVWKYIVDEEKYDAITKMKCSGKEIKANFFPQYRSH